MCIDQVSADEFDLCPLCTFALEAKDRSCESGTWEKIPAPDLNPKGICRGYYSEHVAELKVKDVCKGTCGNCGKPKVTKSKLE